MGRPNPTQRSYADIIKIWQECQTVTVEGVIGGSVVLPCSSAKYNLKSQDINVHWRQNGSIYVYDIIERKASVANQHQRYKNRIETFPEEYVRRNFSIKLTGLTHADAGKYICFITPSDEQETVLLIINAKYNLKSQDINVHWRQNGSIYVYDIIERKASVANQHQRYKNRIETFPEEYVRRNFSIKLTGLTHADAGKYICFITPSDEQETVLLIINVLDLHQYVAEGNMPPPCGGDIKLLTKED
ncbi:V-set domain-containing T-cell activation inhibitor 1-like protein [Labeo rohita]|uniref:V-set domain-containing T-cell activation inhibitor 1-like protein n=1 Tax=Labeo rohita TaxID=84645 RepID=A0A498LRX6_LABRO|nr:V-set domain-containing T-cell activation inhibitor 1-like protein [Labeo rohita]